jgi:hypothetical protein
VLLETILALPVTEAANVLNSLVEIEFLTRSELNANVKKLFANSRPLPAPAQAPHALPSAEPPPQHGADDVWANIQLHLDTKISGIKPQIARLASVSELDVNSLVDSLTQLNVFSIKEVLQTNKNNEQFNFLPELMPATIFETFKKSVLVLEALPCAVAEKSSEKENLRKVEQILSSQKAISTANTMHHLWNDTAQLLVLPVNNKYHFFCSVESSPTEATLEKGEHLVFCLDVSASMNHDAKGAYSAPKSLDHPASSIKKARDLIPLLTLPALKRNISVTIFIWNYKIQNVIEFTPLAFQVYFK